MFSTIFSNEVKHQFRQPANYFFMLLIFLLAFLPLTEMATEPPVRLNNRIINSPAFLWGATKKMMLIVFFIIPIILGGVIYRDTQSRMHHILYSYPFTKWSYVLAKFSAGFIIYTLIISMLGLGFALGVSMPWANPALVGDFGFSTYLYLYGVLILPNCFVLSVISFSIVLLSRNMYAGFVSIFLVMLLQQLPSAIFTSETSMEWVAILSPFGSHALDYYIKNWTVADQNINDLPLRSLIIFNRIFWVFSACLIFYFAGKFFKLSQSTPIARKTKDNTPPRVAFPSHLITKINLPLVQYDHSFRHQLYSIWRLSQMEFLQIIKSRLFISLVIIGLVFIVVILSLSNSPWGAETYPMTWQMLAMPSIFFSGVICTITFLYSGLIMQRERMSDMKQLVDVTAVPNGVLMGAKFVALIKTQGVLLSLVMIGGILFQSYKGFYHFDLPQYFFNLFGILWIHFIIWAMLAFFVHSWFKNPYVGFILLCLAPLGFISIQEIFPQYLGWNFMEQMQFRYNQAPGQIFGLIYSDMDGYGADLLPYFSYKFYWLCCGVILMIGTYLLWSRGLTESWRMRFQIVQARMTRTLALLLFIFTFAFLSLATSFYYKNNIEGTYFVRQEKEQALKLAERKYQCFEYFIQPKIVDVNVQMDIFPNERQFKAKGEYLIINTSNKSIDTLIINYLPDLNTNYSFNKKTSVVSKDTIADLLHFDILQLESPLNEGDSLVMTFENGNHPQSFLKGNHFVKKNGTYIEDDVFPRFGNWISFARYHYNIGKKNHHPHPADSTVHQHSMIAKDADQITYQATVSTNSEQVAISNGKLQRTWQQGNRRYFHYKMNHPMPISYLFTSGIYKVKKDNWNDIDLEIYYHPAHYFNIDRIMAGMKASLNYCSQNFSPYQFDHLRMVEFSQVGGATAHGFPGTIPAGEGSGFIARIDDENDEENDYAFGTAVHEVAHQWWGNQVIPADTRGAKMVVESMAEYVNVMVKKQYKNEAQSRNFIKNSLEGYLSHRARLRHPESPLALSYPKENYIHYPKGAVAFHSLATYLGEKNLNTAIRNYVEQVAFQTETYTTSLEFIGVLQQCTPDSLQYLITDWLETVTLYDNQILDWSMKTLSKEKFQISVDFLISKYRSEENGKPTYSDNGLDSLSYQNTILLHSLPLKDYIEIGIYNNKKELIYLKKHFVQEIDNQIIIEVNEPAVEVVIDPNYLLADQDLRDNRLINNR